jgi:hypothetical protein
VHGVFVTQSAAQRAAAFRSEVIKLLAG